MSIEIENLADYACVVGEGPLWHPTENAVYWTDIETGRLFRYDCVSETHKQVYQGERMGGFTLQEDGSLLLFMGRGGIKAFKDGEIIGTVLEEIPDERETRFNDVMADPAGRVFCGTMPTRERPGRLYRLDTDGTLTLVFEGIGCSNGMGFTPDRQQMYYTDTSKGEIYRFDYDIETGELTNREIFIKTTDPGAPDGMTMDANGDIWCARWGGSGVYHYSGVDGSLIEKIDIPAPKSSCPTFGGADYSDLYVTTAGGKDKDKDGPQAGSLFRVRGHGVKGVPEFVSRIPYTK